MLSVADNEVCLYVYFCFWNSMSMHHSFVSSLVFPLKGVLLYIHQPGLSCPAACACVWVWGREREKSVCVCPIQMPVFHFQHAVWFLDRWIFLLWWPDVAYLPFFFNYYYFYDHVVFLRCVAFVLVFSQLGVLISWFCFVWLLPVSRLNASKILYQLNH